MDRNRKRPTEGKEGVGEDTKKSGNATKLKRVDLDGVAKKQQKDRTDRRAVIDEQKLAKSCDFYK